MRFPIFIALMAVLAPVVGACIPDSERCGKGYAFRNDNCFLVDTESEFVDTDTSTDIDPEEWIGSSCTCDGEGCDQMGVPVPNGGSISGCNDVPGGWAGADRVCLRSYQGTLANDTYFANGFCSLMGVACTGDDVICNGSIIGDYDTMVACPAGSVLIDGEQEVEVMSMSAVMSTKICAPACDGDGDCRTGEHDPVLDETTQYQCIEEQGVKFCYDPRNLPAGYTAEEF